MCQTAYYRSQTCLHYWIIITKPCRGPPPHLVDRDFSTCPLFANGFASRLKIAPAIAQAHTCPECDQGGVYDGDFTRMVSGERRGFRWVDGEQFFELGGVGGGCICCVTM